MLRGKKIILAICGSIAAYKSAFFIRLLVKEGVEIKVIMSESAGDFISPLTLATLSKNPVHTHYFDKKTGVWTNHVKLGLWADLMVIAPLSANTLGKMANGVCDNLLLATYLSARCPVVVAPAMDMDMYQHPVIITNLKKLESFGNEIIEARSGDLASGLRGQGRMAEPEELLEYIQTKFDTSSQLAGKKVMITSGPTHEAIDPVRFIGNHSSGKMGTAIAHAFNQAGAEVIFITGPSAYYPKNIVVKKVNSAQEMLLATESVYPSCDIAVFAAAVADYRPKNPQPEKIKKKADQLRLSLVKNPDIAEALGKRKQRQIHIGFALETNNEKVNAKEKRKKKNFDLIVLNSLNDDGVGFHEDTNRVTFFDKQGKETKFGLKKKSDIAKDLVNYVIQQLV